MMVKVNAAEVEREAYFQGNEVILTVYKAMTMAHEDQEGFDILAEAFGEAAKGYPPRPDEVWEKLMDVIGVTV